MIKRWIGVLALVILAGAFVFGQDGGGQQPSAAPAQGAPGAPGGPDAMHGPHGFGPGGPGGMMRRREMGPPDGMHSMHGPGGKWWKNSELAQRIGLSDQQAQQMEKIYQDHRMQLIDLHASLEKQEAGLEPLIEADQPNEQQVLAQIDKVAQARAALEKSNAQMHFAMRRVLTADQWKKLQAEHMQPHAMPMPRERRPGAPRDEDEE